MTGSRWGTILPSVSSSELAGKLRKSLFDRMSMAGSAESLELLYRIRGELERELSVSKLIPEELNTLIDALGTGGSVAELQAITQKFALLVTELFKARSSVGTVCSLAGSFLDKLLTAAGEQAVRLRQADGEVIAATPWTVLASGEVGREETVLGRRSSFFFVYGEEPVSPGYGAELAVKFREMLSRCFPALNSASGNPQVFFWSGSVSEWTAMVTALLRGERNNITDDCQRGYAHIVGTLSDMRAVCGDAEFGRSILATGSKQLVDSIHSEFFWQLAKDISHMPVAIGMFGRFRTVKSGENRGKFDLKELVLDPLAASVRILSLACGGTATSCTGRIKAVLAAGNIGVALADRLLVAYQNFMREMIRLDLANVDAEGALFLDPDQLSEEVRERFKVGLEDISTLQRLVYQQLVEVERE